MTNYLDLANGFGTPAYVYDAGVIRKRHEDLIRALPAGQSRIYYAMKANSNPAILKLIKSLGAGLDTVSPFEMKLGLAAGFKPEDIIFTPNLVAFAEIEEAIQLGVGINLENLSNLEKLGKRFGSDVPSCIRFNPHIALEGDSASDWYEESKFGIPMKQLPEILAIVEKYALHVEGLHIHSSHVIMEEDLLSKTADILFETALQFKDLKFLDFGGGMNPIPGKRDITDIQRVGSQLQEKLEHFQNLTGREIHLRFEPGRYLVAESGTLLVTTTVVKQNGSTRFAGVNSGFNHLIRPMLYGSEHPIDNLSNPNGPSLVYNVVGNLCEVDDLARDRVIPEIREGDILAIRNAGAYGYAMASQYNSRPRPAEILVSGDSVRMIRKPDDFSAFRMNTPGETLS